MKYPLQLDFSSSNPWGTLLWGRSAIVGALMFLVAICTAWVLMQRFFLYEASLHQINERIASQEQKLVEENNRYLAEKPVQPIRSSTELKKISAIADELNTPWESLLSALESTMRPDIVLLSLDPKPKQLVLNLEGEAKDINALFAYIHSLEQVSMLSDVYLVQHKVEIEASHHPIRFEIEALWRATE